MRATVIIVAAFFAAPFAFAADLATSQQALYKLFDSMRSSAYSLYFEGILIYHRDNEAIPARILRTGNIEKIIFYKGPYQQVSNDATGNAYLYSPSYYYQLPVGNLRQHAEEFIPHEYNATAKMMTHYELDFAGEDTVAGRPVWVLSAIPTDHWRYQHRFCIDKETKLLLDMAIFDEHLQEIERISYAALTFIAPPAITAASDVGGGSEVRAATMENASEAHWGFTENLLPPGFTPLRRSIKISQDMRRIEQWILTDGLVWVSAFIENVEQHDMPKNSNIRLSGLNMHTRKLPNAYVTVVGVTPEVTLHSIAKAIHTH